MSSLRHDNVDSGKDNSFQDFNENKKATKKRSGGNRNDSDESDGSEADSDASDERASSQSAVADTNISLASESNIKRYGMWEEMYRRLIEFRKQYGHCLVPNRYDEDPQLGAWVAKQRRHYKLKNTGNRKSTPMTPDRESRLIEIGFEWSAENPRCVPWETRFVELLEFVVENGHTQVPIKWEKNMKLSNWVSAQRQEYKYMQEGRYSRLTQDRVKLLNSIGFVWGAQRGGSRRQRTESQVPIPKFHKDYPSDSRGFRSVAACLLQTLRRDSQTVRQDSQMMASPVAAATTGSVHIGSKRDRSTAATKETEAGLNVPNTFETNEYARGAIGLRSNAGTVGVGGIAGTWQNNVGLLDASNQQSLGQPQFDELVALYSRMSNQANAGPYPPRQYPFEQQPSSFPLSLNHLNDHFQNNPYHNLLPSAAGSNVVSGPNNASDINLLQALVERQASTNSGASLLQALAERQAAATNNNSDASIFQALSERQTFTASNSGATFLQSWAQRQASTGNVTPDTSFLQGLAGQQTSAVAVAPEAVSSNIPAFASGNQLRNASSQSTDVNAFPLSLLLQLGASMSHQQQTGATYDVSAMLSRGFPGYRAQQSDAMFHNLHESKDNGEGTNAPKKSEPNNAGD